MFHKWSGVVFIGFWPVGNTGFRKTDLPLGSLALWQLLDK